MFGAANALFSGFAFVGLIVAILLQREELELQRKELKLTRKELHGQREQLEEQNNTLRKQNFEDTFFQMLALLNDITQSLRWSNHTGRDCFIALYSSDFKTRYDSHRNESPQERIKNAYAEFYHSGQICLGHYFRSVYEILNLVESSDQSDKMIYVNLLKAQLSTCELLLIFYHCLSDCGRKEFKILVEEYSLLENVNKLALWEPGDVELYNQGAFS